MEQRLAKVLKHLIDTKEIDNAVEALEEGCGKKLVDKPSESDKSIG